LSWTADLENSVGYLNSDEALRSLEVDAYWRVRGPASSFPLLEKVSIVGEVSPFLTRQWAQFRKRLSALPGLADLSI
jgi:hypothetical protein